MGKGRAAMAAPSGSSRWRWLAASGFTVVTLFVAGQVLAVLVRVLPGFALPLLVAVVLVAGATWLIGRRLAGGRLLIGLASAVFLAPYLFVMLTLPSDASPKSVPIGHDLTYWDLSTGRQIGLIEITPDIPNNEPPVVILHGGPGGGTSDVDVRWGEDFAAAGYTTYLYDQAGVGWSPRTDESAYTVAASVADLEAIRQSLGVDEMILAGHSWGGALATHYAVAYEERVAALLLSAPGPFSGPSVDRTGPNLSASSATTSLQFREPLPLGIRAGEKLSAWGVPAVEQLVTQDVEAAIVQGWLDPSTALARGICAGDDPGDVPELMRNSNFNMTANRMINRDLAAIEPGNDLNDLNGLTVPVLIVRGVCDYIPWSVHRHYRDSIPGAQMVVVEGVGHRSRLSEPMLNFLATGDSGRFDYRGAEFPTDDGS